MVKCVIREFSPKDLFTIKPGHQFPEYRELNLGESAHKLKYYSYNPTTVEFNDEIVLIGALSPLTLHSADAVLLLSDTFQENFKSIAKVIIPRFKEYLITAPFDRMQALCYNEYIVGKRFLEFLGFELEGVLRKSGPHKENMALYAKVK